MSATQEQVELVEEWLSQRDEVNCTPRLSVALRALLREREEPCNGSCDISLARRQVGPDGVVPGNSRECAELWEAEASRLKLEVDEVRELCGPGGDGTARGRVESVLSRLAEAQREIERIKRELRGQQETTAAGAYRNDFLLARVRELEAQLQLADTLRQEKANLAEHYQAQLQAERERMSARDRDFQKGYDAGLQYRAAELAANQRLLATSEEARKRAEERLARLREGMSGAHDELEGFLPDEEDIGLQPVMWAVDRIEALLAEADQKGEGDAS